MDKDDGNLYAEEFDSNTLSVSAPRKSSVIYNVSSSDKASGHFDVSKNGDLIYLADHQNSDLWQFGWIERNGDYVPIPLLEPADYRAFNLSPDGKSLAFSKTNEGEKGQNIWIYDIEGGIPPWRLTGGNDLDNAPIWSPDSNYIAFSVEKDLDVDYESTTEIRAVKDVSVKVTSPGKLFGKWYVGSWQKGGNQLAIMGIGGIKGYQIKIQQLERDPGKGWSFAGEEDCFPGEPMHEFILPCFSPDGHWLAYASDRSDTWEVYVEPFPRRGHYKQVSYGEKPSGKVVWSESKLLYSNPTTESHEFEVFSRAYQILEGELKLVGDPVLWPESKFNDKWDFGRFDYDSKNDRLLVRRLYVDEESEEQVEEGPQVIMFQGFSEYFKEKFGE